MNDVLGKAGLRNVLRLERSVGRSVVYPVAPVAEGLAKGPAMWGQWGFREEDKVRRVLVHHHSDVG